MSAADRTAAVLADVAVQHQRIPIYGALGQRCSGCRSMYGDSDGPNSPRHAAHVAVEQIQALADAGLLATPDHDAEVAARALREAADEMYGDVRAAGPHAEPLSVATWLRARADRIEHGGDS